MIGGTNRLHFLTFKREGNERLFDGYLKIKYDVFVEEMHWNKIPHADATGKVLPDSYDENSRFCAAVDHANDVVGVARGTLPARLADMYRKQWYSDFAILDFVQALDGKIATVNAVAVRREYRRTGNLGYGQQPSISDLLMKEMVLELKGMGAEVVLLSAVDGPAYSLMRRIGFKTINPPHVLRSRDYSTSEEAPDLTLSDMAIVTRDFRFLQVAGAKDSDPGRVALQALKRLRAHLDQADRSYHRPK